MPRGGARPGAGRKPGQTARITEARAREVTKVAASGILPVEVMVKRMRELWEDGKKDEAVAVAEKCAPYFHPKLAAIEHSGETTTNVISAQPEMKPEEWANVHADAGTTAH